MTWVWYALPILPWLVLGLSYGFYYLILRLTMRRIVIAKKKQALVCDLPTVSIIVPTYNEGRTIGAMLQNTLDLNYPREKIETIVVDGASTDETCEMVEQYADDKRVRLVTQQSRSGWISAVQEGVCRAKGDVIVLSGSEVFYDREAMTRLCAHFEDPQIGSVTGRQLLFNPDETLATQMEREFRKSQDLVSAAESRLDQPFDVKGEIVAVRRPILNAAIERMAKRSGGTLDICVGFETRAQGQKLMFEPEATYSEYAPTGIRERLGMQVRRGKELIESTVPYLWMIWSPRCGRFGMLIFPYHLVLLVFLPWIFFVGLVSVTLAALSNPYYLTLFIPPVAVAIHERGRVLLSSFVLAQVSLVLAMCMIVARRNLPIRRIDSTRRLPDAKNEIRTETYTDPKVMKRH